MEHDLDLDIRPGSPRTRKVMRVLLLVFIAAVALLAALLPILRAQQHAEIDDVIERHRANPLEGFKP